MIEPAVHITRRDLISGSAMAAGGICLCQSAGGNVRPTCCNTPELEPSSLTIHADRLIIDLAQAPSLAEVGSSVNIIEPKSSLDLIVVHAAKHRYCALAGLCTHWPRPLSYIPSRGVLQCNNFNHSIFDLEGRVVKGPAPKPIRKYAVRLTAGMLEVEL